MSASADHQNIESLSLEIRELLRKGRWTLHKLFHERQDVGYDLLFREYRFSHFEQSLDELMTGVTHSDERRDILRLYLKEQVTRETQATVLRRLEALSENSAIKDELARLMIEDQQLKLLEGIPPALRSLVGDAFSARIERMLDVEFRKGL